MNPSRKQGKPSLAHPVNRKYFWLLAIFAACICGCNEDANRLARISSRLGAKSQAFLAVGQDRLGKSWPTLPSGGESTLEARVAARLSWDKALVKSNIAVKANGSAIQLVGTVADEESKERAAMLAGSTLGVEEVVVELEIGQPAALP